MATTAESSALKRYTYDDLSRATRGFAKSGKLGEGGFGGVYKGLLSSDSASDTVVAVKRLNSGSSQGQKEWVQELRTLSDKRHVNLVRLLGYSADSLDKLLLVYEYMPLGSLETHLFRRDRSVLPWTARMKVALGSARGLEYLHDCPPPVIHRDLKAPNILLDKDFTPKLADFGLAKYGPMDTQTHISTVVMGTRGYAAVEYLMTGHLRFENDIYSFGVLLLELLTGNRAYDEKRNPVLLTDWAQPFLKEKRRLFDLVDSRLQGRYDPGGAQRLSELISACLHPDIHCRPKIAEIVTILEWIQSSSESSPRAGDSSASGNNQLMSPRGRPNNPRSPRGSRKDSQQ